MTDFDPFAPDYPGDYPGDGEPLCHYCAGSGEGMADGTHCSHCRGQGVEPRDMSDDPPDPRWDRDDNDAHEFQPTEDEPAPTSCSSAA